MLFKKLKEKKKNDYRFEFTLHMKNQTVQILRGQYYMILIFVNRMVKKKNFYKFLVDLEFKNFNQYKKFSKNFCEIIEKKRKENIPLVGETMDYLLFFKWFTFKVLSFYMNAFIVYIS
mmetsp:Transcript_40254/g.82391  ORF Transcript_40254/g.82391 Transcript_40254/m.82391 type:complete len:118 (+) Transcript_40254:1672-2025(+)